MFRFSRSLTIISLFLLMWNCFTLKYIFVLEKSRQFHCWTTSLLMFKWLQYYSFCTEQNVTWNFRSISFEFNSLTLGFFRNLFSDLINQRLIILSGRAQWGRFCILVHWIFWGHNKFEVLNLIHFCAWVFVYCS